MSDELKGSGGALGGLPEQPGVPEAPAAEPTLSVTEANELAELKARLARLENPPPPPPEPPQRMTRLMGGVDVWVPYHGEPLGERIVRNEFASIDRAEFERDQAVREIGREVVGDTALLHPPMSVGAIAPLKHSQIDTRTAEPSGGPVLSAHDLETRRHIDRIAGGAAALERAEMLKRHRAAFGDAEEGDTNA